MLAAAFYRALVPTTPHGWRSLFWFGAAPPVLIIAFRWALPETNSFKVMKAQRRAAGEESNKVTLKESLKVTGRTCYQNWVLLVYMTFLMAFFSFCSHGSQDFYPTFLKTQANMSATNTSLITIIGQLGALTGGITVGYISTFFGNRLTIICASLLGAAAVPGFVLPRGMNILAGTFFQQLLVGGAWGPIPVHLVELSPPAIKSLSVGLTAQLGNLASAGSSTIQATMAKRFPLPPTESYAHRYDYGLVILIFLEIAWACIFLTALLGPEMSQEERAAEAEATAYHESLRSAEVDLEQVQIKKTVGAVEGELDDIKGTTEHREVE
jgi:SHS family lactate transporter-like MFS transporter